jgi:glutamine synthetase
MENTQNIIFDYLWIGGDGELRFKQRVLEMSGFNKISFFFDNKIIPQWNYDGSSTGQAPSEGNTEVILNPVFCCVNPLYKDEENMYIVLCDTYDTNGNPLPSNMRYNAKKIFKEKYSEFKPRFGLEIEYFLKKGKHIMPFIEDANTDANNTSNSKQNIYYCGTNIYSPLMANIGLQRMIVKEHLHACLKANIQICGTNQEVSPNQWEYQIGICYGINAGDHFYVARYLLERIAEKYGYTICYDPKPDKNINGSGCHTNYSDTYTMGENGIEEIYKRMDRLAKKHNEHIAAYGDERNRERLTGLHETSSYDTFSFGVGTRNTSVRIPTQCVKDGCGYFEDRRPPANMDAYKVTSLIYKTCCLDE